MGKHIRTCPNCGIEKLHHSKTSYNRAIKNNSTCNKCSKLVYKKY